MLVLDWHEDYYLHSAQKVRSCKYHKAIAFYKHAIVYFNPSNVKLQIFPNFLTDQPFPYRMCSHKLFFKSEQTFLAVQFTKECFYKVLQVCGGTCWVTFSSYRVYSASHPPSQRLLHSRQLERWMCCREACWLTPISRWFDVYSVNLETWKSTTIFKGCIISAAFEECQCCCQRNDILTHFWQLHVINNSKGSFSQSNQELGPWSEELTCSGKSTCHVFLSSDII